MTSGNFSELSDGVLAVRRQLTDIHESVKVKHDLANAFDGSAITFGFGFFDFKYTVLFEDTFQFMINVADNKHASTRFFLQNRNNFQSFWSQGGA